MFLFFTLSAGTLSAGLGEEVIVGSKFISGVFGDPGDLGPNDKGVKEFASSTWVVSNKEVEKFGKPHCTQYHEMFRSEA